MRGETHLSSRGHKGTTACGLTSSHWGGPGHWGWGMSHQPAAWASKQPRGEAGGSEPGVLKEAGEAVSISGTWVLPSFIRHRRKQRMTFICRVPQVRERNQRLWGGGACPGREWILEH